LAARQLGIDLQDPQFSVRQQCGLLGLNRSSLYYQPAGESAENLALIPKGHKCGYWTNNIPGHPVMGYWKWWRICATWGMG